MPIIRHEWKRHDFRRIFGGLAWPGERPGYAVVVGESRFPAVGTKNYHCYLIAEVEEQNLQSLISWCAELAGIYSVQNFYGRQHTPCIQYLNVRNSTAREKGLPAFHISYAPYSEEESIEYQLNILMERLSNEYQTLHLHRESKLPGYLTEVPANRISNATESQFPAVAALGYAVSALTIYKPVTKSNRKKRISHSVTAQKGFCWEK